MYQFSIITVCYNSSKTIKRTLDSLIYQANTFDGNIQSIIIDGGSTDSTISLIDKFISNSPDNLFIEFISEPDNGIYDAMNKGLALAEGQLIALLNSDDNYMDDALNCVWREFCLNPFDILHANVQWRYSYSSEKDIFIEHSGTKDLTALVNGMTINHPTVFCQQNIYKDLGLFDCRYKYVADWVWASNLITKKYNVVYLEKNLVCFDMGGVSNKVILSRTLEIQSVYNMFYRHSHIDTLKLIQFIYKLWGGFFASVVYQSIVSNKYRELVGFLRKK
jgi:glycosyltransferase involved in cell wall biosynthesis